MDKASEEGGNITSKLLLFSIIILSVLSIFLSSFVSLIVPNQYMLLAFTPNQTTNTTTSDKIGAAFLKVIVSVDNRGGGTAKPSDFSVYVFANSPRPSFFDGSEKGTIVSMVGQGGYQVEVQQKDKGTTSYGLSFSGDCAVNNVGRGANTIHTGDKQTCVVTMIFPNF